MSLSRQKLTLIGIFALFLGPVILVMLMRSPWWQYQPSELKNHGHLVQPPVALSLDRAPDSEAKWLILYVLDQVCHQTCIEEVTALRQIHVATGRNRDHLAIVLLSETRADPTLRSSLESIYPEFEFVSDSAGKALTKLRSVNAKAASENQRLNEIRTYVLDPMLNVILAYGVSANPTGLHKDLKRLLKWSEQEGRK